MRRGYLSLFILLVSLAGQAQKPKVFTPLAGTDFVKVTPARPSGYTSRLQVFNSCDPNSLRLSKEFPVPADAASDPVTVQLIAGNAQVPLVKGSHVCVLQTFDDPSKAGEKKLAVINPTNSGTIPVTDGKEYQGNICESDYSDCNWGYTVVGGVEQSDLSAQNSQTDGFVELFVRGPRASSGGNLWLLARFLGAPTTDDTKNVGAALSTQAGNITPTTLSSVGYAVDYMVGYEKDFHRGKPFTIGPIVGFGGTTPLSSQAATIAFAMPAASTNECAELHARFTGNGYKTSLPQGGQVTTTTTNGSASPVISTSSYCSVMQGPTSTTTTVNGVTTTTATDNTPITNLAFTPQDRSSFLLKYLVGIRLIDRVPKTQGSGCSGGDSTLLTDDCTRSIIDFSIGQDQEFTGGYLHNFVFKASAIYQIPKTQMFIFLSAANRLKKNEFADPLLLTPAPIFSGSGTPPAGSLTIPSPNVFVLPLKQANRDFYRIGIAFDLTKLLHTIFHPEP